MPSRFIRCEVCRHLDLTESMIWRERSFERADTSVLRKSYAHIACVLESGQPLSVYKLSQLARIRPTVAAEHARDQDLENAITTKLHQMRGVLGRHRRQAKGES